MEIAEFKDFACKTVLHYQTDLDYDINFMETGVPCLIFLREMGSHMVTLNPFEEYPKSFEKVKYLFGTANRHHLLNEKKSTVVYCLEKSETKVVLYFNGKNIKVIKPEIAVDIITKYHNSIMDKFNTWER